MQYLKCAAKSVFKPSKIALKRMKFQFRSCGLKLVGLKMKNLAIILSVILVLTIL